MRPRPPDLPEPEPVEPLVGQILIQPGGRGGRDEVRAVLLLEVLLVAPVGGGVAGGEALEVLEDGLAAEAHDVAGLEDLVLAVEEPDGGRVGFPPDDLGGVGLAGHEDLGGDDAALVVDAHEDAEEDVEDDPGCRPHL